LGLGTHKLGILTGAIACAALVTLGGCASSSAVPRRQSGYIVGTQGGGSEVVFAGVQVSAMTDTGYAGPEYARRDAMMYARDPGTAFDFDSWPAAPQQSLDDARRLFISDSPTQYMYMSGYRTRSGGCNVCPYWP
jgi:hypothetical protein